MINLDHFDPSGFSGWFDLVDPGVLVRLDVLRELWRAPISISQDDRAVGRNDGDSESRHNVDKWGAVFAVDVFPSGIRNRKDAERFILLAKSVGFNGIGFYPKWRRPGFHLDRRDDAARWGGRYEWQDGKREQVYISLEKSLGLLGG